MEPQREFWQAGKQRFLDVDATLPADDPDYYNRWLAHQRLFRDYAQGYMDALRLAGYKAPEV